MMSIKSINNFFCLGIALTLMHVATPSHAVINNAEAINKSGLQRMLSQRITRNYLMIGADVNTYNASKELEKNIALFDQHLLELQAYAPTKHIKQKLSAVYQVWEEYKVQVQAEPTWEEALTVIELSDRLLAGSESVVQAIEAHANHQVGKLVNVSGRQRMLCQRIAKLYMAQAWNIQSDDIQAAMALAIQEFDQALQTLRQSNLNSATIKTKLTAIQAQWNYTNASFEIGDKGVFVPMVVSVTTDSILKKMNEVTSDYEQLMVAVN